MEQYLLKSVRIFADPQQRGLVDILVKDGRIEAIENRKKISPNVPQIEGEEKTILPAGLDLQVHLRVPGQDQKEVPKSGLKAALCGGFGAILTMPNTMPVIDTVDVLKSAQDEVAEWENAYDVRVLWSAALTMGQMGKKLPDYQALIKAGVRAFTDDGKGVDDDEVMDRAMTSLEKTDVPILQHAEFSKHGGVLAPGPVQSSLSISAYSPDPEWKMVERDLRLLRKHPQVRYHVLHISSAKTVDLIRQGKKEGLRISGEASPHHLLYTSEDINPENTSFKMNPPLRQKQDRDALWEALSDGTLEYMATDHAPHEKEAKGKTFPESAFGTTGLEAALRVLYLGYQEKKLSEKRLVEVFSSAPARFMSLDEEYGVIEVGRKMRAVYFDEEAPASAISPTDVVGRSKNSCFVGAKLPGRILGVFNQAGFHPIGADE